MKGGRGTFYVKNGILKSKGLDLGAEPPHLQLCWVPPPPTPGLEIITPYKETCKSSTSLPWNAMLVTFF